MIINNVFLIIFVPFLFMLSNGVMPTLPILKSAKFTFDGSFRMNSKLHVTLTRGPKLICGWPSLPGYESPPSPSKCDFHRIERIEVQTAPQSSYNRIAIVSPQPPSVVE